MMNQAILKTFFGLTRNPQSYHFLGADIPHRILYLARYDFLDYDPFSPCYYQLSFRGLPPSSFKPLPFSPIIPQLMLWWFTTSIPDYHLPRSILWESIPTEQLPLLPSKNMSSYAFHLMFQPFFPCGSFQWVSPEFFMSNGYFCHTRDFLWVSLFIAINHWVPIVRVTVQPPVYLLLVSQGSNVPAIITQLSETLNIPVGLICTLGETFPAIYPGLCGPAAAFALLRRLRRRHFANNITPFVPICQLRDFSFANLYLVRQYTLNLELLQPSLREQNGYLDRRAGGSVLDANPEHTQQLRQLNHLRTLLLPLPESSYLTDYDIYTLIPQLQIAYPGCSFLILPTVQDLASISPTWYPLLVFCIVFTRWCVILLDHDDSICFTTIRLDPSVIQPYLPTSLLLRTHLAYHAPCGHGWHGYALLSLLLYGQNTPTHMVLLFYQLTYQRLHSSSPPLLSAGNPHRIYTYHHSHLPPLQRDRWLTNHQIDLVLTSYLRATPVHYIRSGYLYNFFPILYNDHDWATVLCIDQHWIPIFYTQHNNTVTFNSTQLTHSQLIELHHCFSQFVIHYHPLPPIATGWCGYQSIAALLSWAHNWQYDARDLAHLYELCTTLPTINPYLAYITAGAPTAIRPTDLDCPCTADYIPVPCQSSVNNFPAQLTPQFLDSCPKPDFQYYTSWNTLDSQHYNAELTAVLSTLPFTHTHHLHLGLADTLDAKLDELLQPDSAKLVRELLASSQFQLYCPYNNSLFYTSTPHNIIGVVLHIFHDFSIDTNLYVVVMRPSCLASDYCIHTGKKLSTNGILFVVVPKSHTDRFSSRKHSILIILRCTLLLHDGLLWTTFSVPPAYEIAYELGNVANFNIIDLFSGIGTWRLAATYLSQHQIICSVDLDRPSLLTQAQTFNLPLNTLDTTLYNIIDRPFLLCHDLQDLSLLPLFSLLTPTLLCASPPCPPWSNAGTQQGLNRPDGLLTLLCLLYSYLLQTPIVLEQVSAFLDHPHYTIFSLITQILGLTIKFKQPINAANHVPVSRNRVLFCCSPSTNTPRGFLPPWILSSHKPTLRSKHFLPLHSPLLRHSSLQLTSEELTTLRDPTLLPAWYPLPTAPTIQRRLRNIGDVLGAIMSSYPKQTSLPFSLLQTNGLFTELISTSLNDVRRFHPLEWAAALGWPPFLRLPIDLHLSWHQLGNTLSPQQALYGLCSALSDSTTSYDFLSILDVLLSDSIDLSVVCFSVCDGFFCAENEASSIRNFVPPTVLPIHSVQTGLYHAPRNLLLRTPTTEIIVTYLQHETFFSFCQRLGISFSAITSPQNSPLCLSSTMLQLFLQYRFLNASHPLRVSRPLFSSPFILFQSKNTQGSFYLLDDSAGRICIVNWVLGDTTGSYHTSARSLQDIIGEWVPLQNYFTNVHTTTRTYADIRNVLPTKETISFTLQVPRAFHLRLLTVVTSQTTLHVRMATALTMDLLYHFLATSLGLSVGTFSLYSRDTLLSRQHECRLLSTNQIHLVLATNSPHFLCPLTLDQLNPILYLVNNVQICPHDDTSPAVSPTSPPVYQYLLTGALGRNFVLLPAPTVAALRQYLLLQFGVDDFRFFQQGQKCTTTLSAAPIELRIPLYGGFQFVIRGLFGTRTIHLPDCSVIALLDLLRTQYGFQDFYLIQQNKPVQAYLSLYLPIYVLGRLRGGMKPTQKHQSTPPQNSQNKLRRQDALETHPIESSSDDLMDPTNLSTDDKLDLILKSTQSNRRETRRMTKTIRSLETEFASSSTRMDNMEQQITQLQTDIQQIKMDPSNKTDPPSRRSSVDSTASGPPITPELMAKKMRTLYFRGFPIDTKQNILKWMEQYSIADVEETYTLGQLSDTAVVVFKDESSLWTFLRQCPNNKWHIYDSSQIYVGLDNQLRGQRPEENKAIRKLYRACIQVLSPKYPNQDISQTHVYRNYTRGIVKIHNGTDWEDVAHWDSRINKLIFAADNTEYESAWKALMH